MRYKKPDGTEQSHDVRMMRETYERGGLTRRDFMQGLMATGLSVTAAGVLVSSSFDAQAQTPKKGGRIRFAWDQHGPADTTDPALFTATIDYTRGRAHYNNLLQFNDDLSLRGELAEEYDVNASATEFTFKLRKDVAWHDGKPFTADDVVYSMNRHIGDDSVSKAKSLVNMVSEWKKVDAHTVKALLNSPNIDLPAILGTFHFKILQNGAEGEYFQLPVGTGPFVCKEFTPGVRSISVRNENYWRDGPWLDELEIFAITDAVARVNALVSGDVDLIGGVDPKAFKQVEQTPGVDLFSVPAGAYGDIVCMRDRFPGNNDDFVLALKYLQRRDRVVRSIYKNQGVVGNDQPVSPAYLRHCAEVEQRPYDPDKAAFHFKKSGVTDIPPLHAAEVGPGLVDVCLTLQAEANKIGMKLDIKRVPNDGYWGAVWMQKPLMVSSWNMRPTANVMLSLAFASDAPWNESQWKNERFDKLLVQSRGELDMAKQQEMYCEMQQIVTDECGTIIPGFKNYVDGKSDKVKGLPHVPLAALGGAEWPEFAWLDS